MGKNRWWHVLFKRKEIPHTFHTHYIKLVPISIGLRLVYGTIMTQILKVSVYTYGVYIALLLGVLSIYYLNKFTIKGVLFNSLYNYGFLFCIVPFYFMRGIPYVCLNAKTLSAYTIFIPCLLEAYMCYKGYKAIDFYMEHIGKDIDTISKLEK